MVVRHMLAGALIFSAGLTVGALLRLGGGEPPSRGVDLENPPPAPESMPTLAASPARTNDELLAEFRAFEGRIGVLLTRPANPEEVRQHRTTWVSLLADAVSASRTVELRPRVLDHIDSALKTEHALLEGAAENTEIRARIFAIERQRRSVEQAVTLDELRKAATEPIDLRRTLDGDR